MRDVNRFLKTGQSECHRSSSVRYEGKNWQFSPYGYLINVDLPRHALVLIFLASELVMSWSAWSTLNVSCADQVKERV